MSHIGVCEYFKVQPSILLRRENIVKVSGAAHCIWPQTDINTSIFLRLLLDVPDGSLGSPILKVGVHATVSDELLVGSVVCNEGVVDKVAIVRMILLNFDSMPGSKLFEGLLCLNCLFCQEHLLQVNITET